MSYSINGRRLEHSSGPSMCFALATTYLFTTSRPWLRDHVLIIRLEVSESSGTSRRSGQDSEERCSEDCSRQGTWLQQQTVSGWENIGDWRPITILHHHIFQVQDGDCGVISNCHPKRRHNILHRFQGCQLSASDPTRIKTLLLIHAEQKHPTVQNLVLWPFYSSPNLHQSVHSVLMLAYQKGIH